MVFGDAGSMASARTPGVARPVLFQSEPPSVVTKTAPGPPAPSPTPAYSGLAVGVASRLVVWGAMARARMSDRPGPKRLRVQDIPVSVLLNTPELVPA